jgi:hypothetical protein
MVNFKFCKFHCYQQTQSFLITPYFLYVEFSDFYVNQSLAGQTILEQQSFFLQKKTVKFLSHKNIFTHSFVSVDNYPMSILAGRGLCYYKNYPVMVNVKFVYQLCQSWQSEISLDYSGAKIIQIFIVTNRFSHY